MSHFKQLTVPGVDDGIIVVEALGAGSDEDEVNIT